MSHMHLRGADGALLPTFFSLLPLSDPNSSFRATWCKTGLAVHGPPVAGWGGGMGGRRGATTATLLHVPWRMGRSLRVDPGADREQRGLRGEQRVVFGGEGRGNGASEPHAALRTRSPLVAE